MGESLEFMRPVYSRWKSRLHWILIVKKSIRSNVEFGIYYGVSNNQGRFWDISNARDENGYDPVGDASVF